jgi:hypothetical protein
MARQKYLHKLHIFGRQAAVAKSLHPGMIAQFKYLGDKIFDKEPLVLVIWNDKVNNNIHGINLNYLPESQIQKLFCTCELLHKGASVYSNEKIDREIQSHMGDYDDTLPYRNLLKEDFTRIMLPTYKETQGSGHPLGKAEAKQRMKMLYEKILKKFISKFDVYRSYKKDKMKVIKVIKYQLGEWHRAKLQ